MTRLRLMGPVAMALALQTAVWPPSYAFAQPHPAPAPASQDPIKLAYQQFEDLKYEESIQTLTGALLRPDNTKPQKIEIYKLLLINLITLNRLQEADGAARGLLVIDPNYEFPGTESPRFRNFFKTAKKKWEDEGRPGLTEPPPSPVTMQHVAPSQADRGTEIRLLAKIDDPQHRVTRVTLFYRTGSRADFQELAANIDGGTARVNVPPAAVKPPFVEYYIAAFAKDDVVASRGDNTAPIRVIVPEPKGGGWVLPVVLLSAVGVAGATVGIMALAGVFNSKPAAPRTTSTVTISIGE